jgi:hypothetical protein
MRLVSIQNAGEKLKHSLWLDNLKKKRIHSQRGQNPGHLAPELASFEERMKHRSLDATIISTTK